MVEEQRVRELELRIDALAERLDGVEAAVADRLPYRAVSEQCCGVV